MVLKQAKVYKLKPFITGRIFILFIIFPFMAHGQQHKKDTEKTIVKQVQVDLPGPPPPDLTSKFKSLQDWLVNICSTDKPEKSIAKYNFGLFESINDYILVLTGTNTYREGNNKATTRIEFTPKHMHFKLPETFYENLSREQLLEKLISQLKSFSDTKEFKTSFLSQANAIVFESNGQTIWSK